MRKTIYTDAYQGLVGTLRQARIQKGLTQAKAGRAVGRSRNWISKIEQHELRLDIVQLVTICRVYGISPHTLLQQVEEELSEEDGSFSYLSEQSADTSWRIRAFSL